MTTKIGALSLDCQDDDLLKEIELDLDNRNEIANKVADSMTEIISIRFDQGLAANKLKERLDNCNGPGVVQRKDRQKKEFHDQSDYR